MKVGDVVKLKSGGPLMTIEAVTGSDIATVWFSNYSELYRGIFNCADLVVVTVV